MPVLFLYVNSAYQKKRAKENISLMKIENKATAVYKSDAQLELAREQEQITRY
jgi:hypothetical protein